MCNGFAIYCARKVEAVPSHPCGCLRQEFTGPDHHQRRVALRRRPGATQSEIRGGNAWRTVALTSLRTVAACSPPPCSVEVTPAGSHGSMLKIAVGHLVRA